MMYYLKLFAAFLCCAVSGTVQWREQLVPRRPPPERVVWDPTRSWFHNMKNEWSESLRANCEYWGKHLALVIVVQFVALCVLIF